MHCGRWFSTRATIHDAGQRYSALGLDDVADHAWVDDTVLSVWISCFCVGVIGVCSVNYETGELLHSVAHFSSRQAGTPLRWHHWQEWLVSDTGHFIMQVTVSQIQRTGEEIVDVIVPQTLEVSWCVRTSEQIVDVTGPLSWKLSICSHSDASR